MRSRVVGRLGVFVLIAASALVFIALQVAATLLSAQHVPGTTRSGEVMALRLESSIAAPARSGDLPRSVVVEALASLVAEQDHVGFTTLRATLAGAQAGEAVTVGFYEGSLLETFGIALSQGAPCDLRHGVIVSHRFHRDVLAGADTAIGQVLAVVGRNPDPASPVLLTVCAVAHPDFEGVRAGQRIDLWVPWSAWPNLLLPDFESDENVGRFFPLETYVRAREPDAMRALLRQVEALAATQGALDPDTQRLVGEPGIAVDPALRQQVLEQGRLLYLVSLLLCLVVALTVLAHIALASISESRDAAIRAALGESRARAWRRQLGAALVLTAPPLLLAGVLAGWAVAWMPQIAIRSGVPWIADLVGRAQVWPQIAGLTGAGCVVLFPLVLVLKAGLGRRTASLGSRALPFRIAAAPVLLSIAALGCITAVSLGAAFDADRLRRQDFGFRLDALASSAIEVAGGRDRALARLTSRRRIDQTLQSLLGEDSRRVALASADPFTAPQVMGLAGVEATGDARVFVNFVSAAYFDVLGLETTPRVLDDWSPGTAVVSEAFARLQFGSGDAVGNTLRLSDPLRGDQTVRIVGVVRDAHRDSPRGRTLPLVYAPLTRDSEFWSVIADRATLERVAPPLRGFLAEATSGVVLRPPRTFEDRIAAAFRFERMQSAMLLCLALALIVIGILGIAAALRAAILERAGDMALRRVLGASRWRLALSAFDLPPVAIVAGALLVCAFGVLLTLRVFPALPHATVWTLGLLSLLGVLMAAGIGLLGGCSLQTERRLMEALKRDAV